jgi:hypothetical protein
MSTQGGRSRTTAFKIPSSLRIQATNATFLAFLTLNQHLTGFLILTMHLSGRIAWVASQPSPGLRKRPSTLGYAEQPIAPP